MTAQNDLRALALRLTALRAELLNTFPFFGRLLLHLQFGYADCGTAYTDMRKIIFDPGFAAVLTDEEVRFVLLHEVMHCVLHHCTRGRELQHELYNIACDIVVNSLILEIFRRKSFVVDGEEVMHLAPDGKEGRHYSAEEVYDMLLRAAPETLQRLYGAGFRDVHEGWRALGANAAADDAWEQHIRAAGKAAGTGSGIPYGLKRYLKEVRRTPTMNWRQILHDFIQHDRSDFVYEVPDRRFQGDFIMPSFQENIYGEKVEKLWFLVDTSGSVTDETLTEAFSQVKEAVEQIDDLSGELSFFDSEVSDPVPFSSVEELGQIQPVGGGGTSFLRIFEYYREHFPEEDRPTCVIIFTDGYAPFPSEDALSGIRVLWILLDSEVDPPAGLCIHLESDTGGE